MKLPRPADFRTLPSDGDVRVMPGEGLIIGEDRFPDPPAHRLTDRFASFRGEFLSRVFPVENQLVLLRLADRFSTIDPSRVGQPFIDRERALRRETFGRHVKAAEPIIRATLDAADAEPLVERLGELLSVRNAIAHQPCWLEALFDPSAGSIPGTLRGRTVGFSLKIADSDWIWTFDDTQIEEWRELLDGLKGLSEVRDRLLAARVEPAERHELGPFPTAVTPPRSDRPLPPGEQVRVIFRGNKLPDLPIIEGEAFLETREELKSLVVGKPVSTAIEDDEDE